MAAWPLRYISISYVEFVDDDRHRLHGIGFGILRISRQVHRRKLRRPTTSPPLSFGESMR